MHSVCYQEEEEKLEWLAGYIVASFGAPLVNSPHMSGALAFSISLLPERYGARLNRTSFGLDPA